MNETVEELESNDGSDQDPKNKLHSKIFCPTTITAQQVFHALYNGSKFYLKPIVPERN